MVRAKQNPTPTTERRIAKSKPNKASVNTRSSIRVLNKIKSPSVVNVDVADSSESTKTISSAKEVSMHDNDKPSNNVKKTVTSANSTSASISKMSDVLINKQGVPKVAISKTATVSTSNNTPVAQKIALPRVLPTTAPPPKYVFIKIDRPPRIFEQLRTVRSGTQCYVSVPSEISTPTASQKVAPNVQQKDQNKSTQPNVSKQLMESRNILSALLQKDNNKNTESGIQQKDQNKNIQPNTLQKDQSPNAVQNSQPSEQDVSTVENDQSSNTKQSNLEKIQSEILNTKFLPIKPKPPGYQSNKTLFLTPKVIQKPRIKHNELDNQLECIVCKKKFFNPRTLLHHQRKLHRVFISSGEGNECRLCGRHLTNPQSRRKHELRYHVGLNINKPHYKCPICFSNFEGMKAIKKHLATAHSDIDLKPQNITLSSKEEFEKWKATMESDTASQYVIKNRYRHPGFVKLEFACHRCSAINCNFKGTGKRKMKYKGSVKTGLFCPAFVMATVSATDVKVTYNFTHLGHECDTEYIAMRKIIKSSQTCTLLRCRVCKKVFSQSTNRKHHEKEVHGLDVKFDLKLKCPVCFTVFPTRKKMMHHFTKSHSYISLQTTQQTFESLKKFYEWKLNMERETKSEYVLDQIYQKTACAFRRFNCHLSALGDKNIFCPANVLLKLNPKEKSSVDVTYCSTHVGHSGENYQVRDKSESSSVTSKCISAKDSHAAALKVYQSVHVIKKDESTWVILPFGNEDRVYEVKRLYVDSNHVCKFKCSSCNVCSHQFKCNCSVSCLKSVCIHIHIVCLKDNQVQEDVSDNSCLDVDMNYCSEQEDSNQPENHVLQEIRGSLELNNLKEQAMCAVSTLINEIRNCNDETKLKGLIGSMSNLKNKINTKHKLPQKKKDSVQKKRRMNDSQDNVLARVIQVAMQLENSNSPF